MIFDICVIFVYILYSFCIFFLIREIFYQSLPTHSCTSCLCNYFLFDFVSEVFIIKVTVKENSCN